MYVWLHRSSKFFETCIKTNLFGVSSFKYMILGCVTMHSFIVIFCIRLWFKIVEIDNIIYI